MNRTQFNKVTVPGLFSFAKEAYQARSTQGQWRELIEAAGGVKTSRHSYEESAYYAGMGTVPGKGEGEPIAYDELVQGPTKRWTHRTFGLGVRMSEELIDDSLYDEIGDMEGLSRELGSSAG